MPWKQYIGEMLLGAATLVSTNGWLQSRKTRKAKEADFFEVASKQNIENAQRVLDMYQVDIVEPMRKEVAHVRQEVAGVRRELTKVRKAVEKVSTCQHAAECPVVKELENLSKNQEEQTSETR